MNSTTFLILFAISMWLLQILLGWRQIRLFNQAYAKMAQQGKLVVGRNEGRFTPKAIIVLAIDDNHVIQNCLIMQGLSVFAQPRFIDTLNGQNLKAVHAETAFPTNKPLQNALKIALNH